MPKFPSREADVVTLAQTISSGIQAHAMVFPNPPVAAVDLNSQIAEFLGLRDSAVNAEAALRQIVTDKNAALDTLHQMMRSDITYAEMIAQGDEAKLNMIGWGNPAPPTPLQSPGQCRALEIIDQSAGWVRFDWKDPVDGGKVAAYKIQRSEDGGSYTDVATAVESEAVLLNQPTMKTLSYKVRAVNKAGEGLDSNTISIVL